MITLRQAIVIDTPIIDIADDYIRVITLRCCCFIRRYALRRAMPPLFRRLPRFSISYILRFAMSLSPLFASAGTAATVCYSLRRRHFSRG